MPRMAYNFSNRRLVEHWFSLWLIALLGIGRRRGIEVVGAANVVMVEGRPCRRITGQW